MPDFAPLNPGNGTVYLQNSDAIASRERLRSFTTDHMRNKQPPIKITKITKITPAQYIRRFGAEAEALKRAYCDIFGLWRSCPFKPCRRHRACAGDCSVCLKRGMASVPRELQWRARQQLIRATPEGAGPPERTARECMPVALFELEAQRERQLLSGPAK